MRNLKILLLPCAVIMLVGNNSTAVGSDRAKWCPSKIGPDGKRLALADYFVAVPNNTSLETLHRVDECERIVSSEIAASNLKSKREYNLVGMRVCIRARNLPVEIRDTKNC
jgi:hypothetical protein